MVSTHIPIAGVGGQQVLYLPSVMPYSSLSHSIYDNQSPIPPLYNYTIIHNDLRDPCAIVDPLSKNKIKNALYTVHLSLTGWGGKEKEQNHNKAKKERERKRPREEIAARGDLSMI